MVAVRFSFSFASCSFFAERRTARSYVVLEFDKNEVLIDVLGDDLSSPTWMFRAHFDVSRISDVSISAYLRTAPLVPGQNRGDMGNDLFLSGLKCVLFSFFQFSSPASLCQL